MANYNAYNNQMFNPYAVNIPQYQQPMQQQPVIQQGGFISVSSEQEASYYPVAPMTTVAFYNEKDRDYMYRKTVGSSLDAPSFDVYKRVKKENEQRPINDIQYAEKSEIEALRAEFEEYKKEMKNNVSKSDADVKSDATNIATV